MLPNLLRRIPPRSPASLLSRRAASTSVSVSQLSPNLKVAAVEDGSYTSSLSVILKAGSRYETAAGVANVLKNSAFKVSCVSRALQGMVKQDVEIWERERGKGTMGREMVLQLVGGCWIAADMAREGWRCWACV
jgi:hypothetical protein